MQLRFSIKIQRLKNALRYYSRLKKSIISLLLFQIVFLSLTLAFVIHDESEEDVMLSKIVFVILNIVVYSVTIFFILTIVKKGEKQILHDEQTRVFNKISATLAHELRTSLTIISGNIQVLEKIINPTDVEVKSRWKRLTKAINEMNDKIDELLENINPKKLEKKD